MPQEAIPPYVNLGPSENVQIRDCCQTQVFLKIRRFCSFKLQAKSKGPLVSDLNYARALAPMLGLIGLRFNVSLMFIVPASAAIAVMQPGQPPWTCSVWSTCTSADTCVDSSGRRMKFGLSQISDEAKRYHLAGDDGDEQVALELPDLDSTRQFAETYTSVDPAPAILIRNDLISDTHSFGCRPSRGAVTAPIS